jgi:hypothetical protein
VASERHFFELEGVGSKIDERWRAPLAEMRCNYSRLWTGSECEEEPGSDGSSHQVLVEQALVGIAADVGVSIREHASRSRGEDGDCISSSIQ